MPRSSLQPLAAVAALALALAACERDPLTGALAVEVRGYFRTPVEAVTLTLTSLSRTDSAAYVKLTDAKGEARFDGLPFGAYALRTEVAGRSGEMTVSIAGDSLRHVEVWVDEVPGTDPRIVLGDVPRSLPRRTPVTLSATLSDDRTPPTALVTTLIYTSPKRPPRPLVLFRGRPKSSGAFSFELDSLPVGPNSFDLTARDGDGRIGRALFSISVN